MKRLTEYDEFGNADLVGIDNKKLYERLVCDETVTLTIAINKLGEFEDFMEEMGCEELEELEHLIGYPRFVDGYDENDNPINKIEFITHKQRVYELLKENRKSKEQINELKEHTHDLNNKLLNLQLFLKDLRDSFHKEDETYEEIDKKLKELGGVDETKQN